MPPYATPYAGNVRDRSRETEMMADLIRRRGDIEAQGFQQQGENSARMWGGITNTVAQGIGNIVQYAEQAPLREAAKVKAKYESDQIADATKFKALDKSLSQMGLSDDERINEYRVAGFPTQANAEQQRVNKVRADGITDLSNKLDLQNKQMENVSRLFRGVEQSPPDQQANRYFDAVIKARQMVDPKLAALIPEVYSPENLQQVITTGEDIRNTYYYQQMAASRTAEALRATEGSEKSIKFWKDALASGLSVAKSPENWNEVMTMARNSKAPQAVMDLFGEYSQENVNRAARFASTVDKTGGTEFERIFLEPFANEKAGRGAGPVTQAERESLYAKYKALGREPDKPDKPEPILDLNPTIANRNDAEKWRADARRDVAENRALKPEQKATALREIETAYQAMLQPRGGGFAQSVLPQSPFGPSAPPARANDGNAMNVRNYVPPPQGAPGAAGYGAGMPPPGAPARAPSAPPAAPPQQRRPVVGDTVYRNGVPYKVTSVGADGWSGDPIQPPRR